MKTNLETNPSTNTLALPSLVALLVFGSGVPPPQAAQNRARLPFPRRSERELKR